MPHSIQVMSEMDGKETKKKRRGELGKKSERGLVLYYYSNVPVAEMRRKCVCESSEARYEWLL
jgi:hypothetical protein